VELLVVIGIIALLCAFLLSAVSKVRSSARAARCIGNLRQIGIIHILYSDANHGRVLPDIDLTYGSWLNYIHVDMQLAEDVLQCPGSAVRFSPLSPHSAAGGSGKYAALNIKASYIMNSINDDYGDGTWHVRGWQGGVHISRVSTPDNTIFIAEIPETFARLSAKNRTNAACGSYAADKGIIHGGVKYMGHPEGWGYENGKWDDSGTGEWGKWTGSDTDLGAPITGNAYAGKRQVGDHHGGGFNALMGGGGVRHILESEPGQWIAYEWNTD